MSRHPASFVSLTLLLLTTIVLSASLDYSSSGSVINSCTTASTPTVGSSSPPPLYLGLDAYRHWDKLSYLEFGDRVSGQSTADPGGSNSDSSHYLRVLPDGEHVLFDQVGPGMVTFMRMQAGYGGPWNLSLDGQFRTAISYERSWPDEPYQPASPGVPLPALTQPAGEPGK